MPPPREPPPHGRAEASGARALDALDARRLFDLATRQTLAMLAALGIPEADQEDLAQEIVLAAHDGWESYDDQRRTRGHATSPRAWLLGITRHKAVDGQRRLARDALGHVVLAGGASGEDEDPDGLPHPVDTFPAPELDEAQMIHTLPLHRLTPVQRRVFVFRAAGMTYEAIAGSERERRDREQGAERGEYAVAGYEARRVYHDAEARLRALVEGDKKRNRAILPFWLGLAGEDRYEPSAEEVGRVVDRVCARLGVDPSAPIAPPPSGPRPIASPPRGGLGLRATAALSAGAGLCAGVLLTATALRGCSVRPAREPAPVVAASVPEPPGPAEPWAEAPAPERAPLAASSAPAHAADEESAPPRARGRRPEGEGDGEATLFLQAAGAADRDPAAALDMLLQQRARFPEGPHASRAAALLVKVCATVRDPRCR